MKLRSANFCTTEDDSTDQNGNNDKCMSASLPLFPDDDSCMLPKHWKTSFPFGLQTFEEVTF